MNRRIWNYPPPLPKKRRNLEKNPKYPIKKKKRNWSICLILKESSRKFQLKSIASTFLLLLRLFLVVALKLRLMLKNWPIIHTASHCERILIAPRFPSLIKSETSVARIPEQAPQNPYRIEVSARWRSSGFQSSFGCGASRSPSQAVSAPMRSFTGMNRCIWLVVCEPVPASCLSWSSDAHWLPTLLQGVALVSVRISLVWLLCRFDTVLRARFLRFPVWVNR